jgi:hypothetical protein
MTSLDEARAKVLADPAYQRSRTLLEKSMMNYKQQHEALTAKYGPDYAKEATKYTLNVAEAAVINEWLESLKPEILALQQIADPLGTKEPYYGAIGGGVTISFTRTGLGDIIIAKESITGKELNVTAALDYFFFG